MQRSRGHLKPRPLNLYCCCAPTALIELLLDVVPDNALEEPAGGCAPLMSEPVPVPVLLPKPQPEPEPELLLPLDPELEPVAELLLLEPDFLLPEPVPELLLVPESVMELLRPDPEPVLLPVHLEGADWLDELAQLAELKVSFPSFVPLPVEPDAAVGQQAGHRRPGWHLFVSAIQNQHQNCLYRTFYHLRFQKLGSRLLRLRSSSRNIEIGSIFGGVMAVVLSGKT